MASDVEIYMSEKYMYSTKWRRSKSPIYTYNNIIMLPYPSGRLKVSLYASQKPWNDTQKWFL